MPEHFYTQMAQEAFRLEPKMQWAVFYWLFKAAEAGEI